MSSQFLNKKVVPSGFKEILSNLTTEILREQPSDIIHFAAAYFEFLLKGGNSKFIYDKALAITNLQNKLGFIRTDTSNSYKSEKNLAKDYTNQLYEYGIENAAEIEAENDNQGSLGELYINIISAKDLKSNETNEETYCLAFLTSDPLKIIKTASSSDAINPNWDHQDKLVLRNLTENDIYETFLIFQVYTNDNGKILVGEANVDVYFALTNPGEWELKLNNSDGESGCGFLNLQVNFLKDTDNEEVEIEENEEENQNLSENEEVGEENYEEN